MTSALILELSGESGRIGDEFYNLMSKWLTRTRTERMRRQCLGKAKQYEQALDHEITSLSALPQTREAKRAVTTARHYKELLSAQVERVLDAKMRGHVDS
jgi:hypothetical protein